MKIARLVLLLLILGAIIGAIVFLEGQKVEPTDYEVSTENSDAYKELVAPSGFINTEPFELADYIGKKVILVDFWTYSCINCQRTIPYLNAWWDKYKDEGLLIVGVHSPEFEFEKNINNVQAAVEKFGIEYPVVLDNDKMTWRAYQNRYWPRKYLIDLNGKIIYDHIGEGAYEEAEEEIKKALGMDFEDTVAETMDEVDLEKISSPETYFGAERNDTLANGEAGKQGVQSLKLPEAIEKDKLYLEGSWDFTEEYAETYASEAQIVFKYDAKDVYMVASAEQETTLDIYVDGTFVQSITVKGEQLYTLVEGTDYAEHTLEIHIQKKGFKAFTFTFG